MRHLSNDDLVAADEAVAQDLELIRPGDLLHLRGELVDLRGSGGQMRTSLSHDDKGNGACEVERVERVEVIRPD